LKIQKLGCENDLDTILDRISDGFFTLDTEWCFTQLNRKTAEALAPNRPEVLIGKCIWRMFPATIGSVVWNEFHRAVDENINVRFSYRCSCLDRWYEVSAYPSEEGLAVFFHDTTDQHKLHDSEETLRLAAEATELGTWDWDLTANKLSLNARTRLIFGLPPEGVPSFQVFLEMIHPDDRERVHSAINQSLDPRGTGDYDTDYRVVRQDNVLKWVREKGKVSFKEKDTGRIPIRFVGTVFDITDSKRAEEELREANRAKDEFLAILSHELRTPLTAISGWATLLRSGKLNQEKVLTACEVIERNVKAQLQLIDDLLNVSRITLGKVKIAPRLLDPAPVIDAAVEAIRPAAAAKGINVWTQANGPVQIFADPDRLQQVIYNLLTNALKFTEKGGEISVSFGRVGDKFDIHVRDTGEGIGPDFLPYVFDRFRQADSSSTRKHGGLGLGLNIVRTITEMHGGKVAAYSEGKGKGATMTVELPLPSAA
jgi:PAS domain S-box-containing protein